VLLMAVAVVGAIAVFAVVVGYVQSVGRQVGPMVTAYRFTKDVPRLQAITAGSLEEIKIPAKWLPDAAIQSFDTTRGLVAVSDIRQGSILQQGMGGPPPELKPGQREIAILINAETGVAGRIRAGDLVDIYATFADSTTKDAQARVIVANARVLVIGALQRVEAAPDPNAATTRFQQNEVVPVTFALSVADSLKVTFAESFATKVRLALIAPGTRSDANPETDSLGQRQIFPARAQPSPSPSRRR
jgi:pilus assembly protein CpaB